MKSFNNSLKAKNKNLNSFSKITFSLKWKTIKFKLNCVKDQWKAKIQKTTITMIKTKTRWLMTTNRKQKYSNNKLMSKIKSYKI